jgi:hypothetical protein
MTDERALEQEQVDDLVIRWWKAGVIDDACADRIQDFERARRNEKYGPLPPRPAPTHESLSQLFADVRAFVMAHPGATVLAADDPLTRQIGWTAFKVEGDVEHSQLFMMGLTSIKQALTELPAGHPLRTDLLRSEGRRRIAGLLADPATKLP